MNEYLARFAQEPQFIPADGLLYLRERIFIIDVVAAQVMRQEIQRVGKLWAPNIQHDRFRSHAFQDSARAT